jgi:transposase
MKITRIALDLAKNVIQVHAVDSSGRPVLRKAFKRSQLLPFLRDLPPCSVGMEACASAHDWGRKLQALGHRVQLLPPQYVKAFVLGQKNDANDAAAICAAMARPEIPVVPVKTVAQQDQQALHRVRQLRMKHRTALINQMRGLLAEYGIAIAQGSGVLRKAIPELLEDAENGLSFGFRELLSDLYGELKKLQTSIDTLTERIERQVRQDGDGRRLLEVPGVGPITASAMLAAIGDGRQFRNGRQMAAFLGLVPRQHSSGGKARLLGIHKHGDCYLRGLLVHGARSLLRTAVGKTDDRSRWLMNLATRRHRNVAIVAQANKTARIVWAILTSEQRYRSV